MEFCTIGMFIIDDIYFPIPRAPVTNIIGGAGSYSALGARLFRTPPYSKHVTWTIHAGSDFPPELRKEIDSWQTSCQFIDTPDRLTTHSLNIYGEDEYRGFEYTTPKKRIDVTMLTDEQLRSKCFHLICAPSRCMQLVKSIREARSRLESDDEPIAPPIFVWEPVPDSCCTEEYSNMLEASKVVDVISPNHHEFAAYFQGGQLADPDLSELATLASRCNEVLANGFQEKLGAVVVRRGEKGCYVASHERHTSFPAYHQPPRNVSLTESPDWKTKVMDPTGGGNGFLGGFCIGVLDDCCAGLTSHEYGALLGNVAASFAIEQVGMPKLTSTENGTELWNGAHVYDRVRHLREQMPVSLQPVNIDD